ncbi:type II secretion system F family protein [Georgenia yuyongxinii]|uniref:Type II secretion system F family protein n=2 Tax=Georgenia yuyongxinii TaxID=2589797 RepID=A0A5B8C7M6_9MICO|nr:type II secretion system F family protein [Georgenia yuyongxinii]
MLAGSLGTFAWLLLAGPGGSRRRTVTNLHRGLAVEAPAAPAGRRGRVGHAVRRLTPSASLRALDRLHARAGRPAAWPLDRLVAAKLALAAASAVVTLLLVAAAPGPVPVLLGAVTTIVLYFLPELLLLSRGMERRERIQAELADTLDQMTIAVEAGLGFDSAMARAGQNGTGALADELLRTLQDIQLGQARRQAYEALATRADVPDLRRFVRAVVQADAFGIAIGDVLRTQAGEMRLKRRQRAEEKAMQIPVKVIFPLMLCILPVLFIVLLGPAVMDIMQAFG